MSRALTVHKTVSGGNDFLQIDGDVHPLSPAVLPVLVRSICSRHNGMGADGMVVRRKKTNGNTHFRIFNRDGKEAELSGNGMAGCAALLRHENPDRRDITLSTAVGPRVVSVLKQKGHEFRLLVEIGPPDFTNATHFPFLDGRASAYSYEQILFTPVSMGNPHAVCVCARPTAEEKCLWMARTLQRAKIFPEGINVEIVCPIRADTYSVLFFERGVGRTRTSSTGSAAVLAVLKKTDSEKTAIQIRAPETPPLKVLTKGSSIAVENTTRIVYKGEYAWDKKTHSRSD